MPHPSDETPRIGEKKRKRPSDAAIAALADRQNGVVAHRQLVALGFGPRAIESRLRSGRLHRIHKGVYAVGHRILTRKGHWMAAVLALGPGAVLSHRSAAALWGLREGPWKFDVTVPTWRRSRTGFWLHCSSLHPNEITEVDGIPVTTVARTLLDLAAILPRDGAVRAVEAAERHELFDLRAVEALLGRAGRRAGTRLLRSVLADYREPVDLRSELERDFLALVRRSGLPIPQANVLVIGYLVDFHWPRSKLVVELDGRSYHSSPRAFELDRLRDAKLLRAGYRVLRVTYRRLRDDPAGVLGDLGALAA